MVVQVIVCGVDGVKMTIDLCQNEKDLCLISVMQLKKKISEKLPVSPGKGLLLFFVLFFVVDVAQTASIQDEK